MSAVLFRFVALLNYIAVVASSSSLAEVATLGVCERQQQPSSSDDSNTERCAIEKSNCEPTHIDGTLNVSGERWYDGYRQSQRIAKGGDHRTCKCNDETRVGACMKTVKSIDGDTVPGTVQFRCAAHEGLCDSKEVFIESTDGPVPGADDCHCSNVKYGACKKGNAHFCAFQSSDCTAGHAWVPPSQVLTEIGTECLCHKVRTGGCVGGFQRFNCALTTDDCPWDDYYPPLELKERFGYSCRLCESDETQMTRQNQWDEIDRLGKNKSTEVVVSILAIAVFLAFVSAAVAKYYCRKTSVDKEDPANEGTSMDMDTESVAVDKDHIIS